MPYSSYPDSNDFPAVFSAVVFVNTSSLYVQLKIKIVKYFLFRSVSYQTSINKLLKMGWTKTTSKQGNGQLPRKGDKITVHCTGIVAATNKKFWSTKDPGQEPFSFNVGLGEVIRGEYSAL